MKHKALQVVNGFYGASFCPIIHIPWYLLPNIVTVFGIPVWNLGRPIDDIRKAWPMITWINGRWE